MLETCSLKYIAISRVAESQDAARRCFLELACCFTWWNFTGVVPLQPQITRAKKIEPVLTLSPDRANCSITADRALQPMRPKDKPGTRLLPPPLLEGNQGKLFDGLAAHGPINAHNPVVQIDVSM